MRAFPQKETTSIGIIGAGAIGVSLVYNFVNQYRSKARKRNVRLYLFGDAETFGFGYPYQQDYDLNLLNREPEGMSVSINDKRDFSNWLSSRQLTCKNVSRNTFGRYLSDRLEGCLQERQAGVEITPIKERVTSFEYYSNGYNRWKVKIASRQIDVDFLIIATGISLNNPYPEIRQERQYIHQPLPFKKTLSSIASKHNVGVLGTRLTGIECSLSLLEQGHQSTLQMISRRGKLPLIKAEIEDLDSKVHATEWLDHYFQKPHFYFPYFLRDFVRYLSHRYPVMYQAYRQIIKMKDSRKRFKAALELAKDNTNPIQEAFYALNHYMEFIWNSFSLSKKQRYLRKHYSAFLGNRVTITYFLGRLFIPHLESGQIQVVDQLQQIRKERGAFRLDCKDRQFDCDWLINCTGIYGAVTDRNVLLQKSLKSKTIHLDHCNTLSVEFDTNRLRSATGVHQNLFAVGQPTFGTYFFTNVLELNVAHVKRILQQILQNIQ